MKIGSKPKQLGQRQIRAVNRDNIRENLTKLSPESAARRGILPGCSPAATSTMPGSSYPRKRRRYRPHGDIPPRLFKLRERRREKRQQKRLEASRQGTQLPSLLSQRSLQEELEIRFGTSETDADASLETIDYNGSMPCKALFQETHSDGPDAAGVSDVLKLVSTTSDSTLVQDDPSELGISAGSQTSPKLSCACSGSLASPFKPGLCSSGVYYDAAVDNSPVPERQRTTRPFRSSTNQYTSPLDQDFVSPSDSPFYHISVPFKPNSTLTTPPMYHATTESKSETSSTDGGARNVTDSPSTSDSPALQGIIHFLSRLSIASTSPSPGSHNNDTDRTSALPSISPRNNSSADFYLPQVVFEVPPPTFPDATFCTPPRSQAREVLAATTPRSEGEPFACPRHPPNRTQPCLTGVPMSIIPLAHNRGLSVGTIEPGLVKEMSVKPAKLTQIRASLSIGESISADLERGSGLLTCAMWRSVAADNDYDLESGRHLSRSRTSRLLMVLRRIWAWCWR